MEGGVLHAAVVPVHLAPVLQSLLGGQSLVIVGIHIPQVVPAGAGPLGHGVSLALGGAAAAGAGSVHPVGHLGDRGFAVVGGLVALYLRKQQGKLIFRYRLPAALVTPDHGDGLAPVALAGEHPVTQLIVDLGLADALLLQPLGDDGDGVLHRQAVEEVGVDHDAGVILGGKGGLLHILAAGDYLDDLTAELFGELPVTVIVGGNGHDSAGAVGGQDVVGDENGDLLPVDRVDAPHAVQLHAGLILVQLGALQVGLGGRRLLIGYDLVRVLQLAALQPALHQGVLWGEDHISRAEQSVRPGGKDLDVLAGGGLEDHLGAGGAADPVALLGLDPVDEVHRVQTVNELLGVLGDLQHPLALFLPDDGGAAALAHALHHLLVGQHTLAGGTPVHRHGGLIGQAVLVQLEEDPLGPLVVAGVGGVHHPVPVEGVAQHMELAGEVGDVVPGHLSGVDVVFDGEVLGGQTESVIADGEQHIIAVHPLLPGDHVHGGVRPGMAHVQAGGGGIGELHQAIELGL